MSAFGAAVARRRAASETEFWGLLLSVAVVLVWGASVALGFVAAVKALTYVGLLAAGIGLFRPGIGLLGVGILSALDAFSRVYVFSGLLPWNTFNYFLLLALVLLVKDARRLVSLPAVLAALLGFLLAVGLLFSGERYLGVQHILGLAAFFGLALFAMRAAGHPEAWVWLGVVTGLLGAGGGLVYLRFGGDIADVNKNSWAYLPLTALCLVAVALGFVADRPRFRTFLLALAATNFAWLFLSESRGTFFVGVAVAVYIALAALGFARRGAGTGLGAVAALAIAVFVAIGVGSALSTESGEAIARFEKLFDPERPLANRTSGRSELARIGWRIFLDNPLGVGTGEFVEEAADIGAKEALPVFNEWHRELQAHSAWVKTIAENGVPGVLLLAAFVASFGIVAWRRRERGVFPLGLLASVVLALAFISTEFQSKGIWLFAATVLVIVEKARWRETAPAPRPVAEVVRSGAAGRARWNPRAASASR